MRNDILGDWNITMSPGLIDVDVFVLGGLLDID